MIVFAPNLTGPLHRVSASGGVSRPVTALDRARGENTHRWPWFLPDGRHFLYLARAGIGAVVGTVRIGSLDSKGRDDRILVDGVSNAIYARRNLLFLRQGTLGAQPFDLKSLTTTADPVPVAERVQGYVIGARGSFSVSESGLLAYLAGDASGVKLAWFDRSGKQLAPGDPGFLSDVHLSPDRKSAAVSILDPATRNQDIWLYDFARGLKTRFTFDLAAEQAGIWSPDGRSIVFNSNRRGRSIFIERRPAERVARSFCTPTTSTSGPAVGPRTGHFSSTGPLVISKTANDLWVLPLRGERKPFPFAQTVSNEWDGQFSPDGRWIAYASDESQRTEVYVAPFPGPGGKRQISTAGVASPDGGGTERRSFTGRPMAS